ncbi:hypothetical protein [Endozoicomonas lisbonensis]|uniref:Transmembrane protein n=1 Tax=Endozoicomonas lisbonensis TaxID=3120522 RepID=A0ABV2SMI4_9GAMM
MSPFRLYKFLLFSGCCLLLNIAPADDALVVQVVLELEEDESTGAGLVSGVYPDLMSSEVTLEASRSLVKKVSGEQYYKTRFRLMEKPGEESSALLINEWQGVKEQIVFEPDKNALMNSLSNAPVRFMEGVSGWGAPDFKLVVISPDAEGSSLPLLDAEGADEKRKHYAGTREDGTVDASDDGGEGGAGDKDIEHEADARGSGSDDGGDGDKYRFNKIAAIPFEQAVKKPLTSMLAAVGMATATWLFEQMTGTGNPQNDRKIAAEQQLARLTRHFGGATVRIRLTQSALESQIALQNTTDHRAGSEFRTYGFVFEGEFAGAYNDNGELPEYKGCPEGCLDYPNWKNVRVVVSIKEYDLMPMLEGLNASQPVGGLVIRGVPQGVNNQDAWVVCIKCEVPKNEVELTTAQKVGQAFWVYLFPLVMTGTGLVFDKVLDMWVWFREVRTRFLYRHVLIR